ncbi:hypothetical protein B0A50_07940 [Salinomyces thailandicus]|uniref:CCHC-type domain-containing protein n=1 Tax=Salinomyces thailandicus TaxID=706561 RepID=A0A4U0TKQ2_9PEZI|nr:hypothetical protein B0A50_07940 [Salinomyces thailandica]
MDTAHVFDELPGNMPHTIHHASRAQYADETVGKKDAATQSNYKRAASSTKPESKREEKKAKKARDRDTSSARLQRTRDVGYSKKDVTYYSCNKKGYYKSECPDEPQSSARTSKVKTEKPTGDKEKEKKKKPESFRAVCVREPIAFLKDLKRASRVFAVNTTTVEEGNLAIPEGLKDLEDIFNYDEAARRRRPEGVEHAINLEEG